MMPPSASAAARPGAQAVLVEAVAGPCTGEKGVVVALDRSLGARCAVIERGVELRMVIGEFGEDASRLPVRAPD